MMTVPLKIRAIAPRAAALAAAAVIIIFLVWPVSSDRIQGTVSLRILSREGTVLRQFCTPGEGAYAQWVDLKEYPPYLVRAVLAAEDRRFYYHPGIDPVAICRATLQNIRSRRIVSGGSTITQQLARIAWRDALPANKFLRKMCELALALKLELSTSKDRILEYYLNRVSLKYNQAGFPAAAKRIFNRDIRFLTREEHTALAILIRQNAVTEEKFDARFLMLWKKLTAGTPRDLPSLRQAVFAPPPFRAQRDDSTTLHFESWIRAANPGLDGDVRTCIYENCNEKIHRIVNSELLFLERYDAENAAVIVLDLSGKEKLPLIAMVGSRNFNGSIDGQVNGCLAVRQAGSALKPLLYALAMDEKGYLPNTIIYDRELGYPADQEETYLPKNYDLSYWGPLTIREALGASRNVPAVSMIRAVGVPVFYNLLVRAGFDHMTSGPDHYGHGLALGTGGASLMQMARVYAAIAQGGILKPVVVGKDRRGCPITVGSSGRLMTEKTAHYITNILSDREIRRRSSPGSRSFLDFPFDVAVKTGTSKDYRDAWTLGFTTRHIVGVWVGNFSGRPMKRISGAWGSGRIFHQVMRLLTGKERPHFTKPDGYVDIKLCRMSGLRARTECPSYREIFAPGDLPTRSCPVKHGTFHTYNPDDIPTVVSPAQGEAFVIDPLISRERQAVPLKISYRGDYSLKAKRYYYRIDNGTKKQVTSDLEEPVLLQRGRHEIVLYEGSTAIDTVVFSVE
ncbi:MAG: hypothetical protein A2176_06295 [Spirochaetes bacterium RBG_13_51_14]|nr:MAG: hypothetical protein A2176_06295 [Spirochaetes bacterium RBG_13_51_14]